MNKRFIFKAFILSILTTITLSCSKDDGFFDSVPNGGPFLRANTVQFYYVDKNGKDLIDPDLLTLPINTKEIETITPDPTTDFNSSTGFYNKNLDKITYDTEKKLYFYSTVTLGNSNLNKYTFYIYFNGETDKMDLRYKYTNKDIIGADYYAIITSWSFNGQHFYSDDKNKTLKVFIKKADGKTTLSFE